MPEVTACVRCEERATTFDEFLCQECANSLGLSVSPDIRRNLYRTALTLLSRAEAIYAEQMAKNPNEIPDAKIVNIAIAPTIYYRNAKRLLYFNRLLNTIAPVEGDVIECGVGAGESLLAICSVCYGLYPERQVWGFDSFEGFPEPGPEDASVRETKAGGTWGITNTGFPILKVLVDSFGLFGIGPEWINAHLTLIRGFFNESLVNYTGKKIALLHLDCDLYQSYKQCLEYFYPKVVKGGLIAVDEYAGTMEMLMFPGAKKAIDEFMADKKMLLFRDKATGKYFFRKEE